MEVNYKARVTIGGIAVLVIGLVVYFATIGKSAYPILFFIPVIGAVFLVIGIAWYIRDMIRKRPAESKPAQSEN
jgi:hypothetical protein